MRLVLVLLALSLLATPAVAHETQTDEVEPVPTQASPVWVITATANLVMAILFAAIAWFLWRAIIQGGQLRTNPLLTGMALIFTTCTLGHAVHLEHTLLPLYAPHLPDALITGATMDAVAFGQWSRLAMTDPILLGADLSAAGAAGYYWFVRHRHADMIHGAELSDDLEIREREARRVQDSVLEASEEALRLARDGQDDEAALRAGAALEEAKRIVAIYLRESAVAEKMSAGEIGTDKDEGTTAQGV